MTVKPSIKLVRFFRGGLLIYAAFLVAFEIVTRGYIPVFTLAVLAFMLGVVTFQTFVVRRQRRIDAIANRPRPDYSLIASMERELYGETFEHEGAPEQGWQEAGAFCISVLASPDVPAPTTCLSCRSPHTVAGGRCGACYRRWKSGHDDDHRSSLRWN